MLKNLICENFKLFISEKTQHIGTIIKFLLFTIRQKIVRFRDILYLHMATYRTMYHSSGQNWTKLSSLHSKAHHSVR